MAAMFDFHKCLIEQIMKFTEMCSYNWATYCSILLLKLPKGQMLSFSPNLKFMPYIEDFRWYWFYLGNSFPVY